MFLTSSVLHVYQAERAAVLRALDAAMQKSGFRPDPVSGTTRDGLAGWTPCEAAPSSATYLVADRAGDWLTVIEADFVTESPETSVVAQRASKLLDTFTLSLVVDDHAMYYNFFQGGRELDSYSSCPTCFATGVFVDEEIER